MNERNEQWLEKVRRIQALARTGLTYGTGPYDLERYQELDQLSMELMADLGQRPVETLETLLVREPGYQTPKTGVRCMIFDGDRFLMVRDKEDERWAPPGGWCDIGFRPSEIAALEVQQEAGLEVAVTRLLAVYASRFHGHLPRSEHIYKLFFQCEITGGELRPGLETSEVAYFHRNELPPLSADKITPIEIHQCFELKADPALPAYFD